MCVIANACATSTGLFDPIEPIGDFAKNTNSGFMSMALMVRRHWLGKIHPFAQRNRQSLLYHLGCS